MDQAEIRKHMRARRRALDPATRRIAAGNLARHLSASEPVRRSRHIGCYLAAGSELSLEPFIMSAWERGKSLYLPCVPASPRDRLVFRRYTPDTPLRYNRYGILEPDRGRLRAPRYLDLVLVPLLAFDDGGNRVGQGGGYYDRSFAFLCQRHHWRKPILMGVAFACQQLERILPNSWDVPLDAIVTENGFFPGISRSIAQ